MRSSPRTYQAGETQVDLGEPECPFPHRPHERPFGMADETDQRCRTALTRRPLDQLVRTWALVAVTWLIVGTIAGLRGSNLSAGLIVCSCSS